MQLSNSQCGKKLPGTGNRWELQWNLSLAVMAALSRSFVQH